MFRMSVLKHMFQMIVKYWNGVRGAFIVQTTANQYTEEDIFFWNAFDVNALSTLYIINSILRRERIYSAQISLSVRNENEHVHKTVR